MADALPTRLIVCVDGEQNTSSGGNKNKPSLTNIQRINASIARGNCKSNAYGQAFNQHVLFIPGVGAADDTFSKDRLLGGQVYQKQIQEVYESCSRLNGSRDEVWLFGFSRGAYVVRAVAGLLHGYGAIASAGEPEFARDFKKLVKEADKGGSTASLALSPVSTTTSVHTRSPPRIQFVGAFDTIKAGSDNSPWDVSFNASIQHMRHAVALHEDRKALAPEYAFPDDFYRTALKDKGRSFVQAHFIGTHNDMGGTLKKAGLALYPLQWMLFEARQCGLFLTRFDGGMGEATGLHDPLAAVFPKAGKAGHDDAIWVHTSANGVVTTMEDLRDMHDFPQNQDEDYGVKLGTRFGSIRQKKARESFDGNGTLRGFCDWAPQGTIVHPSVYLLVDENISVAMENKEVKVQRYLENWRERMLGVDKSGMVNEYWQEDVLDDSPNPGAIRVLVCGNTGVGKSTLINKTFGVSVTTSSNRTRGIHDVREEIRFEGRPDLILHDSGGFEAGADEEFQAIESFLKEKSNAVDVMDRLHVIWFCIDINSPRTLQTATEKLFLAVSQYAHETPIVVVATKKDDFVDIQFSARRKAMKKEGLRFDEEACEEYAEQQLQERVETIRNEMQTVPGGRLDACVAISQDDEESIKELSKATSRCFGTDKIRLLYIRAQVSRIDLKVELALSDLMRRYKKLLRSTTGTAFVSGGSTINKNVAVRNLTTAIINCFGLPSVSATAAVDALKANVWNNLGSNVALALADTFQVIGVTGTVFAAGIPAWAVTGAINTTYVVPIICRLFLITGCDLILVLARSFKEVTFRASGQPNEKDVNSAARIYKLRGYSQHVHHRVKRLVPRRNMAASYKIDKITHGLEDMFTEYKDKLMEDVDLPMEIKGIKIGHDPDDDDTSTLAESSLSSEVQDLKDAVAGYESCDAKVAPPPAKGTVELQGDTPAVELDAEREVAELVAERKVGMPEDVSLAKTRYELQG
ncbi:uncharacterized protein LTR77_006908 [Saxophila tyrrhenica]|uniref:G domain-containing protein n=1 Tax=Saxophila tyrrhenica TaxID=1690608 RepID=A0AAV9P6V1_9PEZI|nr:hypothetical protein LTR77_006908 [Saxophila tyrrhenica]